ncbi:MAG: hypothetical protein OSJ76_09135 [Alphaproteobacteria bacterium]|nr:hypothetical protein [Alphaproteobacteria bacterium]
MTRSERHAEEHSDEASISKHPQGKHCACLNMDSSPRCGSG